MPWSCDVESYTRNTDQYPDLPFWRFLKLDDKQRIHQDMYMYGIPHAQLACSHCTEVMILDTRLVYSAFSSDYTGAV